MSPVEGIILGVVQGLTEFLPISSTAHLRVIPSLLGWPDPGAAFSAVIQLGSVVAVLIYFARDLIDISHGFFKSMSNKDYKSKDVCLVNAIIIGTIPVCILGLLLKHTLETENGPLRSLLVIGGASLAMAILLFAAELLGKRYRSINDIGIRDGLLIGLGQAAALIPGCSRSGSTLTVALLLGLKREDAARFSFLLGIPAIVLSGLLELKSLVHAGISTESIVDLVLGLVVATLVSYAAIWWMLNYLRHHSTGLFIVYRLLFGLIILGLTISGRLH